MLRSPFKEGGLSIYIYYIIVPGENSWEPQKRIPMNDAIDILPLLVEHRGIEPLTSRLRTLRSPS